MRLFVMVSGVHGDEDKEYSAYLVWIGWHLLPIPVAGKVVSSSYMMATTIHIGRE